MSRPDPKDIVGMVAYLAEQLDAVVENETRLIELYEVRRYTVEELAELNDCTVATLYKSPWKLPRFGVADIDGKRRLWLGATVRAWYARPEIERRREWEAMTSAERRRAMGKTA